MEFGEKADLASNFSQTDFGAYEKADLIFNFFLIICGTREKADTAFNFSPTDRLRD